MGLFNSFKTIFSGTSKPQPEKCYDPVDYQGFTITPAPINERGQYRVAGYIHKTIDGQNQEHRFIRSDVCNNEQEAVDLTITKAKVFIDQMADQIFQQ